MGVSPISTLNKEDVTLKSISSEKQKERKCRNQ